MKRYLFYLAIVAISSSIFLTPSIPPKPVAHAEAATIASKTSVHKDASPKDAATATAAVSTPTFDPNNKSTWPTCPANQYVRADNGQCADSPTPTTTQVAVTVPSYSGSHEDWMAAAGISAGDYGSVDYIVSHEGGWNPCIVNGGAVDCNYAANGGQKAYGICQALPGSKMAIAGDDWATNPITQLRWCASYAAGAHGGGWYNNYIFWVNNRWW